MERKYIFLLFASIFLGMSLQTASFAQTALNCNAPSAQIDLDINNVRATLLNGGDLFWDPVEAIPGYEVPKGSGKHSIFSGALWMGAVDAGGTLRVAANTYRQTGIDFYPGPVIKNEGGYDETTCTNFDRFWKINGNTIDAFMELAATQSTPLPLAEIPAEILSWPGRDNPHFSDFALPLNKELAPFWDADGDAVYNPQMGDYPVINPCVEGVYADQMIWWIFNDLGGEHSETGGEPLGMEVGVLAYAFATDDALNNATFYQYTFQNVGTHDLSALYVGQWLDPDLGSFEDDYVGCNVEEKMAYVYNGKETDFVYGENPPLLGVKILEGLKNRESQALGLSSFISYNNDFSERGNPIESADFLDYLKGRWVDGTPLTFGGNGYNGDTPHPYMYSDEPSDSEGWSECTAYTDPNDRRFIMSTGPVALKKGGINSMTIGVFWVQPTSDEKCPDIEPLYEAGRLAESLHKQSISCPKVSSTRNVQLDKSVIQFYPNPSNSNITITLNEPLAFAKETTLTIYNVLGATILSKNISFGDQSTAKVDLTNLEKGTYLLELSNGSQTWTERLLIL